MKQKKKSDVAVLMDYAGSYKRLTFLGLVLSAVSMVLSMVPYICIWLAARDLIAVAPDWTEAAGLCCILQDSCAPIWRRSARRPTSARGVRPIC